MKTTELNGPPPFLQGVYVQENFDFDKCGSALSEATDLSEPDIPPEDTSTQPQLSAMMSDDDFLNSLLTPQETRPLELTPTEADPTPPEDEDGLHEDEGQVAWSLNPEQQKMPRRERFPFNFSWIEELELEFPSSVTFFIGENGSGKSTLLEAIAGLSGFPASWLKQCIRISGNDRATDTSSAPNTTLSSPAYWTHANETKSSKEILMGGTGGSPYTRAHTESHFLHC